TLWQLHHHRPANGAVILTAPTRRSSDLQSDSIGALTVTDGSVSSGSSGALTAHGLTMAGGSVALGGTGAALTLTGELIAASDAAGTPSIGGAGSLMLGAPGFFTVNHGAVATDLTVSAANVGAGHPRTPVGRGPRF